MRHYRGGNLLADLPADFSHEHVEEIATAPGVRIERIVSFGQASPPGFWYDQEQTEWVLVLSGAAGLLIEGEAAPRTLKPGDHVTLPAHCRHRVEWTSPHEPTVWLAVHFANGDRL